ncbi:MAG: ABC transporter permease [Clostridiales bacterium]|nr:ABC transporter permease [Clostridiales bacterium]
MKKILQSYGKLLALAAVIVVFGLLRPKAFLSLKNMINISRQMAPLVIISIGATMVMAVNEFDLSVGSMASLGGVCAALLAVAGMPTLLCFLLAAAFCMLLGIVNGLIVARFRVLSFITTLGMSTVVDGLIYRLTGGATVFQGIPKSFSWFGTTRIAGIPLLTVAMILFVAAYWFFMRHTVAGRRMYAVGGNEEAARIAGLAVGRYKVLAFALCGLMAGLTGVAVASRVGSANTTAGAGYFLQAYAAVYIGCTVSRQGVPNVIGTLVGAAILSILANGLTILQTPTYLQSIITGGIIILAVIAQRLGKESV